MLRTDPKAVDPQVCPGYKASNVVLVTNEWGERWPGFLYDDQPPEDETRPS